MSNMPNKKIAFIGQKGFPSEFVGTSGVELYVEQKIRKLSKQKKQIVCYTRRWTSKENNIWHKITIRSLPTINTKHFDTPTHSLLATIHAIGIERADAIWYQGIGPGAFAFLPKLFGRCTLLTIHSLDWERKKWGVVARFVLRICERLSIANADTIYVVSKQIQQYVTSVYHKNSVLDQLVLPLRPKPDMHLAKTLLRSYDTKPFNYVLFMGRFVPEKRIEWAIQAFRELQSQNLRLLVAGGESHTGEYERRMRRLAGSDPRVRFSGYVFGKEKSMLLAYAKFVVLPSEIEGLPVVVAEALQYNAPCLVPDFLKSDYTLNKSVYYFNHNSYEDFSEMFRRLAIDSNS